ncbi:hypothetical protein KL86CLO1_11872 [uncultured Eubacteriales bacterium]|uniref:Uncharacterized protein n=1 Tax=uncultured Eubacteriales bacterium TaxID=172733 RepID=A0A212JXN1_9FIRM|nr:hypothetical protein KL86CLO1_11872 [uncultured Eubacteriales bacterium]
MTGVFNNLMLYLRVNHAKLKESYYVENSSEEDIPWI